MSHKIPKLTIGIPIYNGEKFVERRLTNILSQTFQDFKILIYDNSTDSTPLICHEFVKQHDRITYIHEKIRPGWIQGWNFIIKKVNTEYFVMASVDDLWSSNFLEENILELETNSSCVASIGKQERMKVTSKTYERKNLRTKIFKNFQKFFTQEVVPIFEAKGTLEQKTDKILKNSSYRHHNGIIRTNALKKSIIEKDMFLWDWAIVLNLIKYGDLHVTKKSNYFIHVGETTSRKGTFSLFKSQKIRWNEFVFPATTFTFWCIRNISFKIFLKNIRHFFWLNSIHFSGILSDLFRKLIFRS
jgi:glycosyltransferase involved in cell wall biosynthesis